VLVGSANEHDQDSALPSHLPDAPLDLSLNARQNPSKQTANPLWSIEWENYAFYSEIQQVWGQKTYFISKDWDMVI